MVQDYALVISYGNGQVTNAFTVTDIGPGLGFVSNPTADQQITYVVTTNTPLLNQFVGASTPLLGTNTIPLGTNLVWGGTNGVVTLGMTNQWHFYVVTNTGPAIHQRRVHHLHSRHAFDSAHGRFCRIQQANATRPEADIDLYVSTDPTLTNLNPVAISNCVNGTQVGASSASIFNGASLAAAARNLSRIPIPAPGEVYYVGVYSEDQEASEYGFIPIFTDIPFSQMNPNGSQIVNGLTVPVNIPDGSTAHPGIGIYFRSGTVSHAGEARGGDEHHRAPEFRRPHRHAHAQPANGLVGRQWC